VLEAEFVLLLHNKNENDATCLVNEKLSFVAIFDGKENFNKILN
jgi:hypothetical protein